MHRPLLLFSFCLPLLATQSIDVTGKTGTVTIPNTPPFAGLGSYVLDFRVTGWSYTGCMYVVKLPSNSYGSAGPYLCNVGYKPFYFADNTDVLQGSTFPSNPPPNRSIVSVTAGNPTVLTLSDVPYGAGMSAGQKVTVLSASGPGCSGLNANQTIAAVSGKAITINYDSTGCAYTANSGVVYVQDFLMRYHRDLSTGYLVSEVWNIDGTGYNWVSNAITGPRAISLPATVQVGNGPSVQLDFVRMYGGTAPVGLRPPLPGTNAAPAPGSNMTLLLDYEFEGNTKDSSGNGLNLSGISTPAYAANPTYAPACLAGSPKTFRAGHSATLDGTQSYPLDGGTILTYSWLQSPPLLSDLTTQPNARWANRLSATPTVSHLLAGPANFQLTVSDGSGRSSTCSVHHGVVATDANGASIVATGNPTADSAISLLVGSMPTYGSNPWPWYDQALGYEYAYQTSVMDTVTMPDYWDTPLPGTVSVTANSAAVTGTGTNFTGALNCNGGYIVVWYATGRIINGQPEYGRFNANINSCQSDTQLTLTRPWPSALGSQAGLNWSGTSGSGYWSSVSPGPGNFYDNVQAYYALYYRSGIDTYLAAARKLADRFWTWPYVDRGNAVGYNITYSIQNGFQYGPARSASVSGLVLRALDDRDGHADMWAGLRNVWAYAVTYLTAKIPHIHEVPSASNGGIAGLNGGYIDPREAGYSLAHLAYCALFDPDTSGGAPGDLNWPDYCRQQIGILFQPGAAGLFPQWRDPVQGAWLNVYDSDSYNSWDYGKSWSGSTVLLTNGSTSVTCNAGSCGFQAGMFALYNLTGTSCSSYSQTCIHAPWIFTGDGTGANTGYPISSGYVSPAYCMTATGCTYISSTQFTLDKPWAGATGTYGWSSAATPTGWRTGGFAIRGAGQDSFMEQILGWAFDLASKAMTCTAANVPAYCDNGISTLAASYNQDTATWFKNYAWVGDNNFAGAAYFAGFPNCVPISSTNMGGCLTASPTALVGREMMGDSYRGLYTAYQASHDAALAAEIDQWFAAMWAKPGAGSPPVASPDGTYDLNFDGAGCSGCGYYISAPNGAGIPKFFGQHFGISNQATWPVARLGGPLPSRQITFYVSGRIQDVRGATQMQVKVTEPTGVVNPPTTCSASPCAVTVNATPGNPIVQVTYLRADGTPIATGQPFLVELN